MCNKDDVIGLGQQPVCAVMSFFPSPTAIIYTDFLFKNTLKCNSTLHLFSWWTDSHTQIFFCHFWQFTVHFLVILWKQQLHERVNSVVFVRSGQSWCCESAIRTSRKDTWAPKHLHATWLSSSSPTHKTAGVISATLPCLPRLLTHQQQQTVSSVMQRCPIRGASPNKPILHQRKICVPHIWGQTAWQK